MGPCDALFEDGRVPGQIHVDHGVGRLQVQPGGTSIGGNKEQAIRVPLEPVDQRLAIFLGKAAIQAHKRKGTRLQERFDEIQHGGPLGKQNDFEAFLGLQPIQQMTQFHQFTGTTRRSRRITTSAVTTDSRNRLRFKRTRESRSISYRPPSMISAAPRLPRSLLAWSRERWVPLSFNVCHVQFSFLWAMRSDYFFALNNRRPINLPCNAH